ncbi:MAG: Crp/Fnr family transcriptional regulator [Granulosicoccaceae bacterium]
MSIEDEYELLSRLELFENLDPIQLKRLIFVSQRYQLQAGEYLFRQGDAMGSVFGIVKGQFSVILETAQGEIIAAHQSPGDLVGEMAAISGEPRNASIRADSNCEVIGFEKDLFIGTVINDPPTALKMMQLLTQRLEIQNKQLAQISGARDLE